MSRPLFLRQKTYGNVPIDGYGTLGITTVNVALLKYKNTRGFNNILLLRKKHQRD